MTANAKAAQPQESKCPHCGGHLGWVYMIPAEGITVAAGQPIPLGITAAASVTPQDFGDADAREARRLMGCD